MNYFAIPGIKSMFRAECAPKFTKETVIKVVCDQYNVTEEDLISRSRERTHVYPRHLAMYLMYEYANMTYKQIGNVFRRDHTTAVHARQLIIGLIKVKRNTHREVAMLFDQILKRHS